MTKTSIEMLFLRSKIPKVQKQLCYRDCVTQAAVPLKKISTFQKILHCSFMILTMMSLPTYVACNIVNWRIGRKPIICPEEDDED